MLKSKKLKFVICGLLGLMTLTSCTRDFNAWLGATFNLDPILFQDNFSTAAYKKYQEASNDYTVDPDNDSLNWKDVFEDTVYTGHPSTLAYIKQVYEWVEVEDNNYIDFNVYNRPFEEKINRNILTNEYVETLKSDPTVIYMCKIISDDPYLNGRYYNEYIKLVDNSSRSYPYTEKGLARLYKKAEDEQVRTAEFYKKFGEQGKTGRYYFENKPYVKFNGYDYYGDGEGKYTVELEEIQNAPVKIKCPYFKNLDSYDFVINTELADFWLDKITIEDLCSGNSDFIDFIPDDCKHYSNSGGTSSYTLYAKRDMIIDSVSFDAEVIQTKEFDEEKEKEMLKSSLSPYPFANITNCFPYNEIEKAREWNSYWYGSYVGNWITNWYGGKFTIIFGKEGRKYTCNGTDDWYLKEGYINHFDIKATGENEKNWENAYIIKKGMPLTLGCANNINGAAFSTKIFNVDFKFKAVTFNNL